MFSSETFDNYLPNQKIQRTTSDIFRELHAEVDMSDGVSDSDCSVGVVADSSKEYIGQTLSFKNWAEIERNMKVTICVKEKKEDKLFDDKSC